MEKKHYHYKTYKPFGMLSQFTSGEARQLRKKRFLSELYPFVAGTMPIGRLDEKSEGLLLLTTDGKLADEINGSGVEKEYYAQVDGLITENALEQLRTGVTIGVFGAKHYTKPCLIKAIAPPDFIPVAHQKLRIGVHRPTSWISIILTEGKFRQVRKMTAAVGFPTLRLVRIRVGTITLENLEEGAVVPLTRPLL
ncbi:pseudouridine synthase [Maribacter chungangensis]|uniref:Pseudouridine synthase n=1 Tax=Maribacter chungangensis TaxID=1069117 RepID=A0ABW3B2T4_9FLAO